MEMLKSYVMNRHIPTRRKVRSRLLPLASLMILIVTMATSACLLFFPAFVFFFRSFDSQRFQKGESLVGELSSHSTDVKKFVHGSERQELQLWEPQSNRGFKPCISPGKAYNGLKISRGYLVVHANGGLNQMRAGICDMVAIARLINATFVIPELDKRSYWRDTSTFSDVFDEDYFIKALENDVPIIKKLPLELQSVQRARKHFRSWSGADYYEQEITKLWKDYEVIYAVKADSRLANNNLPPDIQKLRCRAHYDALRFAPAIEDLGKRLVQRMRSNGSYVALHLRYEKDMLAFTGCTHDLSDLEIQELATIREKTPYWKVKQIDSKRQRAEGFCPLTPKEIGIFLQALGYPGGTRIYLASGEIYGKDSLAELQARYPNLMSKETLAIDPELETFRRHASQLAALDYIVSIESDVFIPSYSGNMARAVEGHRRFLGHRKTIIPDRKQLVQLFDQLDQGILHEGDQFSAIVMNIHKNRQGAPRKRNFFETSNKRWNRFRTEEAFYTNPLPDCICREKTGRENVSFLNRPQSLCI